MGLEKKQVSLFFKNIARVLSLGSFAAAFLLTAPQSASAANCKAGCTMTVTGTGGKVLFTHVMRKDVGRNKVVEYCEDRYNDWLALLDSKKRGTKEVCQGNWVTDCRVEKVRKKRWPRKDTWECPAGQSYQRCDGQLVTMDDYYEQSLYDPAKKAQICAGAAPDATIALKFNKDWNYEVCNKDSVITKDIDGGSYDCATGTYTPPKAPGGDGDGPVVESPATNELKKFKDSLAVLGADLKVSLPKKPDSMFGVDLQPGVFFLATKVLRNEPFAQPQVCGPELFPSHTVDAQNAGEAELNSDAAKLYLALEGGLFLNIRARVMGQVGELAQIRGSIATLADISMLPDTGKLQEIKEKGVGRYYELKNMGDQSIFKQFAQVQDTIKGRSPSIVASLRKDVKNGAEVVKNELAKLEDVGKFFSGLKRGLGNLEPSLRVLVLGKQVYHLTKHGACNTVDDLWGDVQMPAKPVATKPDVKQSFSGDIKSPSFSISYTQTIPLGPIPLVVSAGANAASNMSGNFVTRWELPQAPTPRELADGSRWTPRAGVDALQGYVNKTEFGAAASFNGVASGYASAGIGLAFGSLMEVSAGLMAKVDLVTASFAPRLSMRPGVSNSFKDFSGMTGIYTSGQLNLFRAYVYAYARARVAFVRKEWKKVLLSYDGMNIPMGEDGKPIMQWKVGKWAEGS